MAKSFLNPFPNKPCYLRVCSTRLLKTLGKGEIARNDQFLLFPQCFLAFWIAFSHVYQISNCRLPTLSVRKSLKFVIWERVKRIENTVGKGQIAHDEQFLIFPVFSKDFNCRHIKTRACLGKGYQLHCQSMNRNSYLYKNCCQWKMLTHYHTTNFRLVQIETACRRQF